MTKKMLSVLLFVAVPSVTWSSFGLEDPLPQVRRVLLLELLLVGFGHCQEKPRPIISR